MQGCPYCLKSLMAMLAAAVAFASLLAAPAAAAVYYVDILNGTDTPGNGGSPGASAWRTLHYAGNQLAAGDELNVAPGIYSPTSEGDDTNLTISVGGITIRGDGGEVTIDGEGSASWTTGLTLSNINDITVQNLHFINFTNAGLELSMLVGTNLINRCVFDDNAVGIRVTDCDPQIHANLFFDNQTGIFISANSAAATASPQIWNNLLATGSPMQTGIRVETVVSGAVCSPTIYHNTLDSGSADGIFINHFSGATTDPDIRFNIISNFGQFGIYNLGGSPNVEYNNVYNNAGGNYSGVTPTSDLNQPNGDDPVFLTDGEKHYLQSTSTSINYIPTVSDPIAEDINGTPRPQGTANDIGCYEIVEPFITPGTYYVDISTGNDDPANGVNAGAGAWQTLHYSLYRIHSGDPGAYILNLAPGNYSVANGEHDEHLHLFKNNVTIQSSDPWGTEIDGTGSTYWDLGLGIDAANAAIRGLKFRNFTKAGLGVYNCSPVIAGNLFLDNQVGIAVDGDMETASPEIVNNLIWEEASGAMQYGITVDAFSAGGVASPNIFYNTIDGGTDNGIDLLNTGGVVAPQISFNIVTDFGQYGIGNTGGSPTVDYNNFYNNTAGNYSGVAAGSSDIAVDPLYVGGTDYHLTASSPCIDTIPQAVENSINDDLDGVSRPQPAGGNRDMGCYELPYSTLDITITPAGAGSIASTAAGINCPGDCSETVETNTTIQLTATPISGYLFSQWEDAANPGVPLSTTNPDTFTINADQTIVAVFTQVNTLTVAESPAGTGTISATGINCPGDCSETIENGSTIELTAAPGNGYIFTQWEDAASPGSALSTANPDTFTIGADQTIVAVFTQVNTLTVAESPAGTGTITATGINCPGDCSETIETGSTIELTAISGTGYIFTQWEDAASPGSALSTVNPDTFTIGADQTIVAVFTQVNTLTVAESPAGTGTISATGINCPGDCSETIENGTTVELTASAASGYTFSHWSEGAVTRTDNPDMITLDANKSITAVFIAQAAASNSPPAEPTNARPADNAHFGSTATTVVLESSPFSDPEGDAHLLTHWMVRREDRGVYNCDDYDASFNFIATTDPGLTTHTVSGLSPGMQYVWKVGHQDDQSGQISWSPEYRFIVGDSATDDSVSVPAGVTPEAYRMVSFPIWDDTPSCPAAFADEFGGEYDVRYFRIGTYDAMIGGYRECDDGLVLKPGRSYWMLSREGTSVFSDGIPVATALDIEIALAFNAAAGNNGWNMIGSPNSAAYLWGDVEILASDLNGGTSFGPVSISDLPADNPYIDLRLWRWEAGTYQSDTTRIDPHRGYWVRAKRSNLFLRFPTAFQQQAGVSAQSLDCEHQEHVLQERMHRKQLAESRSAQSDDSPPAPMGVSMEQRTEKQGGCFISELRELR